jgi:hypothetical protein
MLTHHFLTLKKQLWHSILQKNVLSAEHANPNALSMQSAQGMMFTSLMHQLARNVSGMLTNQHVQPSARESVL